MISAVKSLKANFKFDIVEKKLELYPINGKFDFIISSIAKNCGHYEFKEHYKCSFYKPCLLYTSPSPRDSDQSRMPSSA